MTSSTALSAGGGGGVGWQVDLPGLASLVLNLGASGLKRFAEAGVDFHTILCMGEIAEKCPASNEYRRELSVCRRAQRKESQWLYKLVEIGAATNFVADELLKKRAGENVVAFMSAILPVMSEASCDHLLLKLFEVCDTPLDKTPGFGQLRAIRETLIPLSRKTQFKDRVFQYHVLSKQLLSADVSTISTSAYESIPSEETAVRVILSLSRLVQEDSGLILAYHGLRGAAWVIAYARHVLGLSVCVLRSTSKSVPISGDYHSARVVVRLYEGENKCELLLNRNVLDFFVTKSLDPSGRAGWSIDVRSTKILENYIPISDPLRKGASVISSSMVDTYIQILAERFGPKRFKSTGMGLEDQRLAKYGLIRYPIYCLPALRKRARRILLLLGFEPVDDSNLESDEWSNYIILRKWKPTDFRNIVAEELREEDFAPHLVAGPAWIKSGLGHIQPFDASRKVEVSSDPSAANQDPRLDATGTKQLSFLFRAVEAACWLAFTDWDQSIHLLSASFFEDTATWDECLVFKKPLLDILAKHQSGGLGFQDMTDLSAATTDICIGGRQTWTPNFSQEKLLAFQHAGIVFVQNAALYQTLDLQSCFIHLLPGAIIADGERHNKIYNYSTHEKQTQIMTSSSSYTGRQYAPEDLFPGISFSTSLEISGEDIILQQNALVRDHICAMASPGTTSKALAGLYVTKECDHRYYDAAESDELYINALNIVSELKKTGTSIMKQGLLLAGAQHRPSTPGLWLQAVDQNAAGQWLAYQDFGTEDYITVLQRGCCIACVCEWMWLSIRNGGLWGDKSRDIRIIHGRLTGEDME